LVTISIQTSKSKSQVARSSDQQVARSSDQQVARSSDQQVARSSDSDEYGQSEDLSVNTAMRYTEYDEELDTTTYYSAPEESSNPAPPTQYEDSERDLLYEYTQSSESVLPYEYTQNSEPPRELEMNKMQELYENQDKFPPEIWEKIHNLTSMEEVYKYLNNHIIRIRKTNAGLMKDIENAIDHERTFTNGLLWFGGSSNNNKHELFKVMEGIKNYKSFVNDNVPITNPWSLIRTIERINRRLLFYIVIGYIPFIKLEDYKNFSLLKKELENLYNEKMLNKFYEYACKNYNNLRHEIEMITVLWRLKLFTANVKFSCSNTSSQYFKTYRDYWNSFGTQTHIAKDLKSRIINYLTLKIGKTEKFEEAEKLIQNQQYNEAYELVRTLIPEAIVKQCISNFQQEYNKYKASIKVIKQKGYNLEDSIPKPEDILHYPLGEGPYLK
jgi:hypothetical protein